MPRPNEVTPYYIRTAEGNTFYVHTLAEALEQFLGDDGYRLTLTTPNKKLTIRRSSDWEPGRIAESEATAFVSYSERDG